MGKEEVQVVVSGKDQASDVLKKIGGIMAATFSVAAITAFGKAAVDAASEQEQAETKLAQALGRHSQALIDQANALQKTTRFADDQIINAQASLAMFTKNEAQLKQLTKATLDFAAAKGMDLTSAADLVGKSLGAETSMLSRYGIETSGAANSTERFTTILQGLGAHFGGQAAAQALTYEGSMSKLKNAFGDVLESIGQVVSRNPAVLAAINVLTGGFANLAAWIDQNKIWLMELTQTALVWLVRGLGYAIDVVGSFVLAWDYLKVAANAVIYGIAVSLDTLIQPFNYVMNKLVEFGAMKSNPLAGVSEGLAQFRDSSKAVLDDSVAGIDSTIATFGGMHDAIQGYADKIGEVAIKSTETKDTIIANNAAIIQDAGYANTVYQLLHEMELARQSERTAVTQAEYEQRAQSEQQYTMQKMVWDRMNAQSEQARANITNSAYSAMQTQLKKLVDLNKFSVRELRIAIAESVEAELLGIASKAAVWALFELAMGLATLFTNPAASGAHFAAAGQFAMIGGVALATAMAVHKTLGQDAKEESQDTGGQGTTPENPSYVTPGNTPLAPGAAGGSQVTNVTLQVFNPLSNQNWDEMIELDLAPALARAQSRGVI